MNETTTPRQGSKPAGFSYVRWAMIFSKLGPSSRLMLYNRLLHSGVPHASQLASASQAALRELAELDAEL